MQRAKADFWGELSPCEHLLQIYDNESTYLETLAGFVGSGLTAGDAVLVIATPAHREALRRRLCANGVDVDRSISLDQYIPLDADETLAQFIVNGWPDEERFNRCVTELLVRARLSGRRVRAFGEMVALLWERGHNGATVSLEHLWTRLCEAERFPLFCAYPKIGFTQDQSASVGEICAAHTKIVGH